MGVFAAVTSRNRAFCSSISSNRVEGAQNSTNHVPFQNLFFRDASLSTALESLGGFEISMFIQNKMRPTDPFSTSTQRSDNKHARWFPFVLLHAFRDLLLNLRV